MNAQYKIFLSLLYVLASGIRICIKFCILAFVISNAFLFPSLFISFSFLHFYFSNFCLFFLFFFALACSFAISTDQLQKTLQSTCRRQVVVIAAVAVNNSRIRKKKERKKNLNEQNKMKKKTAKENYSS